MTEKESDGMNSLPKKTNVLIIGGGVIGCSVAYHLAKLGWKDVDENTKIVRFPLYQIAGPELEPIT